MAALLRPKGRGGARRWRRCFGPRGEEEHGDGGAASPEGRGRARRWRCFGPRGGEEHGDSGVASARGAGRSTAMAVLLQLESLRLRFDINFAEKRFLRAV